MGVLGHQFRFHRSDQGADLERGGARIAPHGLDAGIDQLGLGATERQAHDAAGLEQPGNMLRQLQDGRAARCFVNAEVVERQGAPLQALGENVDGGVRPSDERAVAPYHPISRCHDERPPCRRLPRTGHNADK